MFVERNADGKIVYANSEEMPGFDEVPDDDAELLAFLAGPFATVASISDRQFFQQLAVMEIITTAEALAAVRTGDIPAVLQGYVDAIDDDGQRFAAEMLLSGATVFERNHPLTEAIGAGQGMSAAQVDEFFAAAAAL